MSTVGTTTKSARLIEWYGCIEDDWYGKADVGHYKINVICPRPINLGKKDATVIRMLISTRVVVVDGPFPDNPPTADSLKKDKYGYIQGIRCTSTRLHFNADEVERFNMSQIGYHTDPLTGTFVDPSEYKYSFEEGTVGNTSAAHVLHLNEGVVDSTTNIGREDGTCINMSKDGIDIRSQKSIQLTGKPRTDITEMNPITVITSVPFLPNELPSLGRQVRKALTLVGLVALGKSVIELVKEY